MGRGISGSGHERQGGGGAVRWTRGWGSEEERHSDIGRVP